MDRTRFFGLFSLLAEATNKEPSDALMELWFAKFGSYPAETFAAAVSLATDKFTFFPSPVEFAAVLDPLLPPEEREIQDGIRLMRSWMSREVVPIGLRDPADLAAVKTALRLPPPTASELAKLAERGPGDEALRPGPVVARLTGADLPALASGGR